MIARTLHSAKKFTRSLSFKLSFYAGLFMLIAILVFAYHSIRIQEHRLIEAKKRDAVQDTEVIKAAIWNGMMTKNREVIREILHAIGREEGFEEINLYDREGIVRYSTQNIVGQPRGKQGLQEDVKNITDQRSWFSADGMSLNVVNPLFNAKSCSTAACHAHPKSHRTLGLLEVKVPLNEVRAEIAVTTKRTTLFAFALFIAISSIIGLAVLFFVTPHLKTLERHARRMARGDYVPSSIDNGSDEISTLSRTFDEMSKQVNERTAELDAGRKMFKGLFDEVPCYLTVVDRNYRIVRVNRRFREEFGNLEGQKCFRAYKGLATKCPDCPVALTFATGESYQSEETWRLGDKKVHVLVKTNPIVDESGIIVEVLEMSVDVTRLKELQRELEKKQHEYQYLFENVPCYLTVVDKNFNVVQANKLFEQDFGESIGQKCYSVYKKQGFKCENCPVEKTFTDGVTHTSEHVWRRNGEEISIIAYTAPVTDDQGRITGVMEMCTNITEVKRLQTQLVILGETIAGMSHTIKNILNGLQGGVYMVDSGLKRQKRDRIEAGWAMVKKNVTKVSELVQGILYASKEREPEYQECDPGTILQEVCELYENQARTAGIRIERNFSSSLGLAMLDPAGIHSVLANLISNAVHACELVRGTDHVIGVSGSVYDDTLMLKVSDDGPGMPEEVKAQLFNKFFSTKGSKGTGLGLVVTRKVVEEHGGWIDVESEPGKGTTFHIGIPWKPAPEDESLQAAV